jgi:hypothetical protein
LLGTKRTRLGRQYLRAATTGSGLPPTVQMSKV